MPDPHQLPPSSFPSPATQVAPAPPDYGAIAALVHGFYADVRAHPLLGPVFEEALADRWEPHLARMVDFWATVALGARSYRGNVQQRHRALQGVTPAHFAAWVGLWKQHTERRFAPDVAHDLQQAAHGVARNLFRALVGRLPDFAETAGHGH
ncbi:group III truncated hemoglobin [Paracidovorax avenae]